MEVFSFRLKLLLGIIVLIALLFSVRLFFVQVVNGNQFKEKAEGQYSAPVSVAKNRGSIFFQDKRGTLLGAAITQSGYLLALNPSLIEDVGTTYDVLKEILPEEDLDEESFFFKAYKKDDPYEEILHRLDEEQADTIRALKIPGVKVYSEKWRVYPRKERASHLLGFVGYQDDSFSGRYGIERYYNDTLEHVEKDLYVNFFAEVFANIENSLFYDQNREGDVVLSIEPEVQRILEETLLDVEEKWKTKNSGGIIIDPKTGAIYAIAALPAFDPNLFQEEEDYTIFSNPLVESVFELGSIVKPLTVASGLDAGVITHDSTYEDYGFVEFDGARIENYDGKTRGVVSMQEVLNQSLNTGAVHVMKELGKDVFARYFLRFGLGEETGIDIPNEIPGLVGNLESPREIEYATASFGQGIAVTPIAMVRALSIIANDGIPVTPHVGDRIEYTLGSSKLVSYDEEERVISKEASEAITRMLVEVMDEALLGGSVKFDRYSVAAKTGTAQIANTDEGGYYDDRFLHSFFGYFPAYEPRFLVFLYINEPKEVRYASQTLTEPFVDIIKFLINYYEVAPDR